MDVPANNGISSHKLELPKNAFLTNSPTKKVLAIQTSPQSRLLSGNRIYGYATKSNSDIVVWVPVIYNSTLKFQRMFISNLGYKCRKVQRYKECGAVICCMGPVEVEVDILDDADHNNSTIFNIVGDNLDDLPELVEMSFQLSEVAVKSNDKPQSKSKGSSKSLKPKKLETKTLERKFSPAKSPTNLGFGSSTPRFL